MRLVVPTLGAAAAVAALLATAAPAAAGAVAVPVEANGPYSVHVMSFREIPFRSVVRQQYDYSCGSAAVATLMRYHYGRNVGETEVFSVMWKLGDQQSIRRVGFSMLDMKRFLDQAGLQSDGYRMTLDELAEDKSPAIALIDLGRYRHFVVVKGVSRDRVLVGDPALGIRTFARADFEKIWNGIVLMVHEEPGRTPKFNDPSEWRPWARAPLHAASGTADPAELTRELPPLYQITPPQLIPPPAS
jgi:predicted double-glycine peptidase